MLPIHDQLHSDLRTLGAILDRITDQIVHNLLQLPTINRRMLFSRGTTQCVADTLIGGHRVIDLKAIMYELSHIDRAPAHFDPPILQLAEVQQLIDQCLQLLYIALSQGH